MSQKPLLIGNYIFKYIDENKHPILLSHTVDLSGFNYFTRRSLSEYLLFTARLIVQKSQIGIRQTINVKENPFVCHIYTQNNGLSCVLVSVKEYPNRIAFSLIHNTLKNYEHLEKLNWEKINEDQKNASESMTAELNKYQDPQSADKLLKIQKSLDEVKEIISKDIEQILQRGESLDKLMAKSKDLSEVSQRFYKKAKKMNQCCQYY